MAIYKRGKTYWFEFVFQGERVRKSSQTSNRRAAEQIEAAYKVKLAKGEVGLNVEKKKDIPTFRAAVEIFLNWSNTTAKTQPSTKRRYETATKALLNFFGNIRIDRITTDKVEAFRDEREKQKKKPPTRKLKKNRKAASKGKMMPSTVNKELATLKILFNYLIKKDYVSDNPVKGVVFLEEVHTFVVVSQDEERLYLMAASQPLQDVASIMFDTGARPDEIYRMQKQDINLEEGFWQIPYGKTKAARRRIPLTGRAFSVIEKRFENTQGSYLFGGGRSGKEDKPLVKLNAAHNGAIKRSGLRKFRLYDLRHTFASRMAMAGVDLITLSVLLGHSKIRMVERYAHPIEAHKLEAMKRLESFNLERRKVA